MWPFQVLAVDCWNGSVSSVQAYVSITGTTFPVLRNASYLQASDQYGINYDNYLVIDADGIVRYTSVGETFTVLGRFHDANLRTAILGEVTLAQDPDAGPSLRVTNPVAAGGRVQLDLGSEARPGTRLGLYDARGHRVRDLDAPRRGGWRYFEWTATSASGQKLSAGVYFLHVSAPETPVRRRKVVVLHRE